MSGEGEHFRRAERRALALSVGFRSGESLQQRGTTSNLGTGGAFIRCDRPPTKGSTVQLQLNSPTAWDPLDILCEVRWVVHGDESGFGVRFDGLSAEHDAALREFLASLGYDSADGDASPLDSGPMGTDDRGEATP